MPLARALYRAKQFLQALFPNLREAHLGQARSVLSEGEIRLFLTMETRDQRHGIRVMEHLLERGESDRDLLAAALLHDCGKGRVPVWLRVLYVLTPESIERLAGANESGPAYRLVHHARLGAELVEQAGSSPATIRYISGRVAEHEHAKISVLRAADDRS